MRILPPTITALLLISSVAFGRAKPIIYGNDDRLDVRDVTDAVILDLVRSTAVMIPNGKLTAYMSAQQTGRDLLPFTLKTEVNACVEERFSKQAAIGDCTGFLVGEKTLVTAGHCMIDPGSCEDNTWAFDYQLDKVGTETPVIHNENLFKCSKVIRVVVDNRTNMDYAIVELDRKVEGRLPLKLRSEGSINKGEEIFVIGHPSGLPAKVAGGAHVMESDNTVFFKGNLDTYGGNSGSPVFNSKTLEVEGILVRGAKDYVPSGKGCNISNIVAESKATEAVTRILGVAELFGRVYVEEPMVFADPVPFEIEDIDLPELEDIEILIDLPEFIVDEDDDETDEEEDEEEN